jgi:hypothetical protein
VCLGNFNNLTSGGRWQGKWVEGRIWYKYYVHMYVNAKMIPVETIPGIEREGIKESCRGMNSSMIYLVHCKNFCKCYNVPLPSTTIKK